jgi:hypothetical protein
MRTRVIEAHSRAARRIGDGPIRNPARAAETRQRKTDKQQAKHSAAQWEGARKHVASVLHFDPAVTEVTTECVGRESAGLHAAAGAHA